MRAGSGRGWSFLPGSMGSPELSRARPWQRGSVVCQAPKAPGRALSRTEARQKVTERDLRRQMEGVWYDSRPCRAAARRGAVRLQGHPCRLRAQKELVKVIRTLRAGAQLQECLNACRSFGGGRRDPSRRGGPPLVKSGCQDLCVDARLSGIYCAGKHAQDVALLDVGRDVAGNGFLQASSMSR